MLCVSSFKTARTTELPRYIHAAKSSGLHSLANKESMVGSGINILALSFSEHFQEGSNKELGLMNFDLRGLLPY